ncbi:hypothetical protein F5141DRAFT_1132713 [Pisolithus sp. B1]|nr:hypothetical protein F5141DRAFT_1132713 [Pisolithus sp. B1]
MLESLTRVQVTCQMQVTLAEMSQGLWPFSRRLCRDFCRDHTDPSLGYPMPFLQNLRSSFKSAFTITSRVTEDDFVIFVVGPTGSGKSWFIRELLKSDDIRVAKSGQHPCTKNVQALRCNFNNGRNNIVVIDTPSFHTELEDFDAENEVTTWIKAKLTEKCRGSGVLFLHTLARDPTHYDMSTMRRLTKFAMSFDGKFLVPSCACRGDQGPS